MRKGGRRDGRKGRETGRRYGEKKKVKTVEEKNVWKVELGLIVAMILNNVKQGQKVIYAFSSFFHSFSKNILGAHSGNLYLV